MNKIKEIISRHKVTHSISIPEFFKLIMENLTKSEASALQIITLAGDKIAPDILKITKEKNDNIEIVNEYGITECSVLSTIYRHQEKSSLIKIGKPIGNTRVYVVDDQNRIQPMGVPGEMCIAGPGLARGYLNQPELTAGKFIPNPFIGGEGLYKTGDLARWRWDGNIEYLGRIDHQVKIRGFRIELQEIEQQLVSHESIKQAVVVVRKADDKDEHLIAYYIERAGTNNQPELWPSVAEFFVYDDLLYYAMTNDKLRNNSYKVAINRSVEDKVVLDIGTGKDAILARFCVEAGAKKIYAIELLEETYKKAKENIKELGLEEKITLIHGDATKIKLPEKVDVCVSEIVGPIGGCEGGAVILNKCRDLLKKDGVMIPGKSITKIAAAFLPGKIHQEPGFTKIPGEYVEKIFKNVGYSFDLRLCVKNFPASNLISNKEDFEILYFSGKVSEESNDKISLKIDKDSRLDGFLVWLNLHTIEGEVIDILKNEHCWLPVFLPVFYPGIDVWEGDRIEAECIRTLSANKINPDYKIKGVLIRENDKNIDFEYDLPHFEKSFRKSSFYRKLFNENGSMVTIKDTSHGLTAHSLRDYLSKNLPVYMIPSYFIPIEKIPLTPNGKVDKKALTSLGEKLGTGEKYELPQNKLEESIASAWKDILKLEKVGIHDNFFDIGGNSIKIIQVTNKLKQSFGINIDVNTMFQHTTIHSLAGYLDQWKIQEKSVLEAKGKENDILIQIENYITGNYDIKAYYKKYLVDHDAYKVLFICRGLEDTEKLCQDLKEKFKDVYPNYIKFIESEDEIIETEKIGPESFSTAMGLVNQVIRQEEIKEELDKNLHFTSLLKENNILRKHEVSPPQRAFLLNLEEISRSNIPFSYDFKYPIEFEGIKKIVIKIINQNSLLRSIIVKHADTYYIHEFDSYSNIQIPFIDLSYYSLDCQEKIQEILKQHLEQSFDVIENVLYRAVAVKLNNSNYKLVFQFNHLVFDGGSFLALQEQIDLAQKETPLDIMVKKEKIDYYDYSTFLSNLKYEKVDLENYLPVSKYLQSLETLRKSSVTEEMTGFFFEIDLSILNAGSKAIYNEILFFSFAKLIGNLYGIDNVPIIFYSYGRNYKDGKFNSIIGTFQDFIPVLFDFDRKNDSNFKYLLENFLDYREYIKNSNLNFANFIIKKYREREEYLRLLSSPFKFNPLFGTYDVYKTRYSKNLSKILSQRKFNADRLLIEMTTSKDIHSDKLMVGFIHNSSFKIDQLKETFVKHFQEITQYFNRK